MLLYKINCFFFFLQIPQLFEVYCILLTSLLSLYKGTKILNNQSIKGRRSVQLKYEDILKKCFSVHNTRVYRITRKGRQSHKSKHCLNSERPISLQSTRPT